MARVKKLEVRTEQGTTSYDIGANANNVDYNGSTVKDKLDSLKSAAYTESSDYIAATEKGAASGVAELGSDGKVPTAQLPDAALLALGETSSTAYRGDRGKIAYDHSQTPHANPSANQVVKKQYTLSAASQTALPDYGHYQYNLIINNPMLDTNFPINVYCADPNQMDARDISTKRKIFNKIYTGSYGGSVEDYPAVLYLYYSDPINGEAPSQNVNIYVEGVVYTGI